MTSSSKLYPLAVLAASLSVGTGNLLGQAFVFPTALKFNHAVGGEAAYTFGSRFTEGGSPQGDIDALYTRLGYRATFPASERLAWIAGVEWQRFGFSIPAGVALPTTLNAAALRLGAQWQMAERWGLNVELAPGLYSDFEDISWNDVKVPFALRVLYQQNDTLTWLFGLSVDVRNEWPVVGGVGVRWQFAPDWTLNASLPSPRLEYAPSRALTLFVGGDFKGGAYRVAEDFGDRHTRPELNDRFLTYRELRAGGGLRYRVLPNVVATVDGGWAFNRRFRYLDAGVKYTGKGAPYVEFSLLARY